MKKFFLEQLVCQARNDESIYLITADVGHGLVEPFQKLFPERYINIGIAEQNALAICAGLAESGKNVFFYGIIPFLTFRCLDQIRMFMNYMGLPIKIIGNGKSKKYQSAGYSHWAIEDETVIKAFGIRTETPENLGELDDILNIAFDNEQPIFIRL
jgi:transketolase